MGQRRFRRLREIPKRTQRSRCSNFITQCVPAATEADQAWLQLRTEPRLPLRWR